MRTMLFFLVSSLVIGCGSNPKQAKVQPVKGSVQVNGTIPQGATVIFLPVAGVTESTPSASGVVQADGTFQLTTYKQNDGVAAGEYLVGVSWKAPKQEGDDSDSDGKEMLGNFASPKLSGLKSTVTLGKSELDPIQITFK